jgi:tetratricopeptide (TPR) repeat protein
MIVRNEAGHLRRCLASVQGLAEEMVIADTGSTDGTPAIAAECGARVVEIPWENDFAAARNRALREVRSAWVLSLDADEMLDPAAAAEIAALIAAPDAAGYQVSIRNYLRSVEERIWDRPARSNDSALPEARSYAAYVDHQNVRLFRRDPRIVFMGRVHESVGPSIEGQGLPLGQAPFLIHHFGLAADAESRAAKNRLYRELGQEKVREMPRNAQAHLELGLLELDAFGNTAEALACFEHACRQNPRFGVAWFFAGLAHFRLGDFRAALRCLREAGRNGHRTPTAEETCGDAYYNLGEFAASERAYRRALALDPESVSLESKLGLTMARGGAPQQGLALIRRAVQRRPDLPDGHDRLVLWLVWQQRTAEAALAAENKLGMVRRPSEADFGRAAALWSAAGDWARATAVLHVGLQVAPQSLSLQQSLRELAARQGEGVNQLVTALAQGKVPATRD